MPETLNPSPFSSELCVTLGVLLEEFTKVPEPL